MSDAGGKSDPKKASLQSPRKEMNPFIGLSLLIVCALLYPLLNPVLMYFWMHREKRFAARMRERGRTISWMEVREALETGHGTVIEEMWTNYGRLWWTPNDIHSERPEIGLDCVEENVDELIRAQAWIRAKYCDGDKGSALLLPLKTRIEPTEYERFSQQCRFVTVRTYVLPPEPSEASGAPADPHFA